MDHIKWILCEPQNWNNLNPTKKSNKLRNQSTEIFREKRKNDDRDEFLTHLRCKNGQKKKNNDLRGLESENPFLRKKSLEDGPMTFRKLI